jgi:hypothetical protein
VKRENDLAYLRKAIALSWEPNILVHTSLLLVFLPAPKGYSGLTPGYSCYRGNLKQRDLSLEHEIKGLLPF